MSSPKIRIALLGTRGIPAAYGGFETFAEELSTRLVDRGHKVTVYARRPFRTPSQPDRDYRGVTVRVLPTVMQKYLETPLHSLISFLTIKRSEFDCVLLCNAANSPFAFIGRLKGLPIAINVDGIERRRSKWNFLGRWWYRLGEACSILFASRVIADAQVISDYYKITYGADSEVIAYGASAIRREPGAHLAKFGLSAQSYILYVSRLEPENNALGVIQAYVKSGVKIPLVIVGDAPYSTDYKEKLRAAANERVVFTGFQFGEAYQEFQSNCLCYIQATEVGGTHPALIEAMAYGNCVIANGTPENIEVLGNAGLLYDRNNFDHLAQLIERALSDQKFRDECRELAHSRASQRYNWSSITTQYEELLLKIARIK